MKAIEHNNLGAKFYQQGDYLQAKAQYQLALKLQPNYPEAHFNLAVLYLVTQKYARAITHFSQALNHPSAKDGLIQTLTLQAKHYQLRQQYSLALNSITKALAFQPNDPHLLYNQAIIHEQLGQLKSAIAIYQQLIQLYPDFYRAYPQLYMAKRKAFDWENMFSLESDLNKYQADTPFTSLVRSSNPKCNHAAATLCSSLYPIHPKPPQPHHQSIIRLGYISKDFGDHPIGQLLAPLLTHHDRSHFHVTAFSYGQDDHSHFFCQTKSTVDAFVDITSLNDSEALNCIRNHQIDILIDVTGNTNLSRYSLLALRPAPIQITWLGLLGTSGTSFFDYNLVDPIVVPPSDQSHYTEALLHLPHVLPIYPPVPPTNLTRAQVGLPEDKIVLACFNQIYKITPPLFTIWMKILKQEPDTVLWLWEREADSSHNLRQAAIQHQVDPQRLIFFHRLPLNQHLQRAQLADLALDTHPYGGGATTAQTLQAEIPLVTLAGNHYPSRLTTSLLDQVDLPQLITHSPHQYQATISNLVHSPHQLRSLKSHLRHQAPNLPEFINNLEKILQSIV